MQTALITAAPTALCGGAGGAQRMIVVLAVGATPKFRGVRDRRCEGVAAQAQRARSRAPAASNYPGMSRSRHSARAPQCRASSCSKAHARMRSSTEATRCAAVAATPVLLQLLPARVAARRDAHERAHVKHRDREWRAFSRLREREGGAA